MEAFVARHPSAALLWRIGGLLDEGARRLRAFARRIDARLVRRRRAAGALAMLSEMSERELQDIGVSRASLRAIAYGDWERD